MSDTTDVTYTGPHLEVEVVDYETGFTATVAHGKTATVPVEAAASLLEQGPEHWLSGNLTEATISSHAEADATAEALGLGPFAEDTKLNDKRAAIDAARKEV